MDKADNLAEFKKRHKNVFIKDKISYAKETVKFNLRSFLEKFKTRHKKTMGEMGVEV